MSSGALPMRPLRFRHAGCTVERLLIELRTVFAGLAEGASGVRRPCRESFSLSVISFQREMGYRLRVCCNVS